MIGVILGGRILYVISYWNEEFAASRFPKVLKIWEGGLVFYGGLIGATLGAMIYLHWKKLPMWKMADVLAPSIALGGVFRGIAVCSTAAATDGSAAAVGHHVFPTKIGSIRRPRRCIPRKFTTRC